MSKIFKMIFVLGFMAMILSVTTIGKGNLEIISQPDPDLIYSFDTLLIKYVNNSELNQPVIEVLVNTSFNEAGLQKIIEQRSDQNIPTKIFINLDRIISTRLLAENRKMRSVQDIFYSKQNIILGMLSFSNEWSEVTAGSVDEAIYDAVMAYVAKNEKKLKRP